MAMRLLLPRLCLMVTLAWALRSGTPGQTKGVGSAAGDGVYVYKGMDPKPNF